MTSKKSDLEHYRNMLKQPWGKIQYEITFANLLTWKVRKFLILDLDLAWSVNFFLARIKLFLLNLMRKCSMPTLPHPMKNCGEVLTHSFVLRINPLILSFAIMF